ncbi:TolC family protein [Paraflavitalea sp. CAU 1676]|uniref:TolC family protein n=1 Tax=Paraflavitalea sp. CAU 1676 TaxID=3032598 RepID=UPI0023D9E7A2|nr:TolC family protein [Paraflavitalea sp. CAU 1676]MDF2191598.1 TolC family protein [Paraflavitalea sp. CAU 1676]
MKHIVTFTIACCLPPVLLTAQDISLQDCFRIAGNRNIVIQQSQASLLARQYNLAVEKQRYIPKVDLLASYTYLSRPLEINLQTVREGILDGSSQQAVNTANTLYQELTGNELSQAAQDRIYNTSKNILGAVYPDYNPPLSRQSYFIAGLAARQPIYLGSKLTAARNFAESEVIAGNINTALVEKDVHYALAVQYIRIRYLNTLLKTQQRLVEAFTKNRDYSEELVKNEILAPYQKSWTKVLLSQARTTFSNLQMDKQNALLELNKLLGLPLDSALTITDTLQYRAGNLPLDDQTAWQQNPAYQLVKSKIATAQTAEQIARSFQLPNIFAVGNINLYQNELPVTLAPWMVGVEMQWNLFSGTQSQKRKKAARQLVEEVKLAEANTRESLQMQLRVARNKISAAQNEISTADSARTDIGTTRRLVDERVQNQLSSLKDLNDVLIIQGEVDKAYYTAILAYYIALATYWNIYGTPERITELIP